MTQSAVSQHVAGLERACGLTLVERGSRPVAMTAAGHALVRHGRGVILRVEDAEAELGALAGIRDTRLRFGSFPTALATFVPAALQRFARERPDITLTVVDDHLQRLLPRLADGELDLALVYEGPTGSALTGVDRVHLLEDRYRVVLPARHRLAKGRGPLRLTELRDQAWVGGGSGSAWWEIVRRACRAAGFDPVPGFTSDDYVAVQAFVAAGLGVSVVPGLAVARTLPGVRSRPLLDGPERAILAVRPQDRFPPAGTQAMLDLLVETTRHLRES